MEKKYALSVLAIFGLLSGSATAQIAFPGTPHSQQWPALHGQLVEVAEMPPVDVDALLAEDERTANARKPYRFGVSHSTDFDLGNSGTWTTLPNGDRTWQLSLHCPQAISVNFTFDDYQVPEGAMVFVSNPSGQRLGGFTSASNGGLQQMGVTYLPGELITVEYNEPAAVAGQGRLRIGQVTHGYRGGHVPSLDGLRGFGHSGACNNNVICPEGDPWRDQIRSVGMMMIGGGGFCSGTLLNNCAEDGTAYFLTAEHCIERLRADQFNSIVISFNFESPQCATNVFTSDRTQTVSGTALLVRSAGTDVALLRLSTAPPDDYDVYYSGWDASGVPATRTVGIHHPSSDQKKITFNNDPVTAATFERVTTWEVSEWEDGTTEGGSSGSGLWDQNHRLVGQLYGGYASCNAMDEVDHYGRLSVSWPLLQPHLGNCGNVLDGFDPRTTSVAEREKVPGIALFPNPTDQWVTLQLPAQLSGTKQVRVLDLSGRSVREHTFHTEQELRLDLSGVPNGTYVLEVLVAGSRFTDRVTVLK